MKCKSCGADLVAKSSYCMACGAPVIRERITARKLLGDVVKKVFGWDSKFLVTLRRMVVRPEEVLEAYIEGVRRRFTEPFAFFAIGAAVSLLFFSTFSDEYMAMNVPQVSMEQAASESEQEFQQAQFEFSTEAQEGVLKHWTIASFLLLPFYALIGKWVYGKPCNYGEHLVINAYIQGITFLLVALTFLTALVTNPAVYQFGQLLILGFYAFAYARLYRQSAGQIVLSVLKFLGILALCAIALFVLGIGYSMITGG